MLMLLSAIMRVVTSLRTPESLLALHFQTLSFRMRLHLTALPVLYMALRTRRCLYGSPKCKPRSEKMPATKQSRSTSGLR